MNSHSSYILKTVEIFNAIGSYLLRRRIAAKLGFQDVCDHDVIGANQVASLYIYIYIYIYIYVYARLITLGNRIRD